MPGRRHRAAEVSSRLLASLAHHLPFHRSQSPTTRCRARRQGARIVRGLGHLLHARGRRPGRRSSPIAFPRTTPPALSAQALTGVTTFEGVFGVVAAGKNPRSLVHAKWLFVPVFSSPRFREPPTAPDTRKVTLSCRPCPGFICRPPKACDLESQCPALEQFTLGPWWVASAIESYHTSPVPSCRPGRLGPYAIMPLLRRILLPTDRSLPGQPGRARMMGQGPRRTWT